jgi:hypothetical protein
MSNRKKKWIIGIGLGLLVTGGSLVGMAFWLAKRFEPYIREQAVEYLRKRFDSEVELASLRVHLPRTSPVRLLLTQGRGVFAAVEGEGLSLRQRGRRDTPPMFAMKRFGFRIDLGALFDTPKVIPQVRLEGMEITIPPKGKRPDLGGGRESKEADAKTSVIIEEVLVRDARLIILPKDQNKVPLTFEIHHLRLESAGRNMAMKYDATLTNAKPRGQVQSSGTFGPWVAVEPSDTTLAGEYRFEKADLSVFVGIAGILRSTGRFTGSLSSIAARGEAWVPDFRLKMSGNPVPLYTRFETEVDGTNGNTKLKPVIARLGSTDFTTSGGVIKHEGHQRRAVQLDVSMPRGNLPDLLRLAMKGPPFMEGRVSLKTKIDIPPLASKVREKLRLEGSFELADAKFLRSQIQDQIDGLSRRAQGQPNNPQIDEVVSGMRGVFTVENEAIAFKSLVFTVPGANIRLAGGYDLDRDALDFHGTLRLRARVSQTMTGWKRWALKPVDPIFAREGAGTWLRIKVAGSSREPKFGLDRGRKE